MQAATAKQPTPIATLCEEHRYMQVLLETMQEKLQEDGMQSLADYYLLQDISRYLHSYTDAVHHPTEDILFERLVARDPAAADNVERLRHDHNELETATARIRQLVRHAAKVQTDEANAAAAKAIDNYIVRLQKHIQIEETLLFPRTVECLSHADWKTIGKRLSRVEDPLFGHRVEREYRALYEYFASGSDTVSRRLTKYSFLQFDNLVVSADAFQRGFSEMLNRVSQHTGQIVDDTRAAAKHIADDPRPGTLLGAPFRYAKALGEHTLAFAKNAAGIYVQTARNAVQPFFGKQSGRRS